MDFKQYQEETQKTAIYPKDREDEYLALGIASEAGEYAGRAKKTIRDKQGKIDDNEKIERAKELGDCMWYISQIATQLGFTLEEIAEMNIRKLRDRQNRDAIKGSGDNR